MPFTQVVLRNRIYIYIYKMITEVFFNGLNLIDLQEKYVCVMSSVNHITYCQAGQLFGIHVKNLNKISIFLDLERTQEM